MGSPAGTKAFGENEMYEDIAVAVANTPASAGMFGQKVRDAILSLDSRVAAVESVLANYKFKNIITNRASITGLSADPDLVLPLEANQQYFVEVFIVASGLAAADIQTNWGTPAGSTGTRRVLGPSFTPGVSDAAGDNQTIRLGGHNFSTAISYNLPRNSVGNQIQIQEIGVVNVGATAGDVSLNWAQVVSNATATAVHVDSFIRATRA
jgi:hypothetical protein